MKTTSDEIAKFLKEVPRDGKEDRFRTPIRRNQGSCKRTSAEIKAIINEQMRRDDETTAVQLHTLLVNSRYKRSFDVTPHLAGPLQLLPANSHTEQREEAGVGCALQNVQG